MFNSNSNGYSLADIAAATGNSGSKQDGVWGDGSGAWWIIILFLFCFAGGWGNGGWGGNRDGGSATPGVNYSLDLAGLTSGYRDAMGSRAEIANGFYDINTNLLTGFANTQAAMCAGNNALLAADNANTNALLAANTSTTNTLNNSLQNLSTQLASCCCENRFTTAQSFADLNYNLASIACQNRQATADAARDIIDNQNANTRTIMDFMVQSKIDQLTSENTSLRGQISQAEQNAYLINALGAKAPQAAYVVANPYTGTAYAGYGCGATSACGCGV